MPSRIEHGQAERAAREKAEEAMSDPAPRLLTGAMVADRLTVSQKTVRRWIDAGELRIHRLGRSVRISEADLREFLEEKRQ